MKHRSIGLFIIIAATLAAAPQALHEINSLRNEAGSRVRSELWSAFLNLQVSANEVQNTSVATSGQATDCTKPATPATAAPTRSNGSNSRSWAGREAASEEAFAVELARMITDPAQSPHFPKKAAKGRSVGGLLKRGLKLEVNKDNDLAMIVPPGIGGRGDLLALANISEPEMSESFRLAAKQIEKNAYRFEFQLTADSHRAIRRDSERAQRELRRILVNNVKYQTPSKPTPNPKAKAMITPPSSIPVARLNSGDSLCSLGPAEIASE